MQSIWGSPDNEAAVRQSKELCDWEGLCIFSRASFLAPVFAFPPIISMSSFRYMDGIGKVATISILTSFIVVIGNIGIVHPNYPFGYATVACRYNPSKIESNSHCESYKS
jgi:hypothetical protein